jgi:hypothetical protein
MLNRSFLTILLVVSFLCVEDIQSQAISKMNNPPERGEVKNNEIGTNDSQRGSNVYRGIQERTKADSPQSVESQIFTKEHPSVEYEVEDKGLDDIRTEPNHLDRFRKK